MPNSNEISAADALRVLLRETESAKCIDVRSPGEFAQGSIPHFTNAPILSDLERHQVGISYKQQGQSAAVELGHRLVSGHREAITENWRLELGKVAWPMLTCWRGGLRSQLACEWIAENGTKVLKVAGGYKALRRELMLSLENLPHFFVVSGPTGSGKTQFLRQFSQHVDLEKMAHHRGSAFGRHLEGEQPAQASFENGLAFSLRKLNASRVVVEDESLAIGRIHLPQPLKKKMNECVVVKLQVDLETRVNNIFAEYIGGPLKMGVAVESLRAHYQESLKNIEKKLGGLKTQEVLGRLNLAFAENDDDLHRAWIRELLVDYYDNAYAYGFLRSNRKIAFEGDWNECLIWMQKQFA